MMSSTQPNATNRRLKVRSEPHTNAPIVVHSHLRWDFVWQRPQQILSRLARHHPILFLEDPIEGTGPQRLEITAPQSNIVRVVPVLPGFSNTMSIDAQSLAVLALLAPALRTHPFLKGTFSNPIQWFYSPMTAKVFADKFDAIAVVYDCKDELANFKKAPPDLTQREEALLARADIVFTGGHQLFMAKSQRHRNTHFFGCGVDVAHFGRARLAGTALSADIANLPRPIIGYFGVIDERLDYDLIAALAKRFPQGSVAMVGPLAKVDPDDLPKLDNIHWLGQRAYTDLPNIVKAFDVCMMPFALNAATQYINPTKTLEYMAAGKPIVSTAIADVVRNFTPVVSVAYSQQEFGDAVQQALTDPRADLLAQGVEIASGATWDVTVTQMRALMLRAAETAALKRSAALLPVDIKQHAASSHRDWQPVEASAPQATPGQS
jgi:glycosyltransferase involved in cell wall biosynthesis